eukprot:scaffold36547_cov226-Isochrysis_galbana.AAC.2
MARQEPLAVLGLPLRGPSGAAPGIWRPQLELLRLPVRGGRSSSISISMMSPDRTPRCTLCPPALPGSAPAFSCLPASAKASRLTLSLPLPAPVE